VSAGDGSSDELTDGSVPVGVPDGAVGAGVVLGVWLGVGGLDVGLGLGVAEADRVEGAVGLWVTDGLSSGATGVGGGRTRT
jgi:hypothetical protein